MKIDTSGYESVFLNSLKGIFPEIESYIDNGHSAVGGKPKSTYNPQTNRVDVFINLYLADMPIENRMILAERIVNNSNYREDYQVKISKDGYTRINLFRKYLYGIEGI